MALRFRRRIKLAPGIHWNISGSGSSFSFGPRGATVSTGKRGTYLNTGLPGTGLYSRQRIDSPRRLVESKANGKGTSTVSLTCRVGDDGTVSFFDASGEPASDALIAAAKKQGRDAILDLIKQKCDEINDEVEALGRLHHDTPSCVEAPTYKAVTFDQPRPETRSSTLQAPHSVA